MLGESPSFFTESVPYSEAATEAVLKETLTRVEGKLHQMMGDQKMKELCDAAYDYLSEEDIIAPADLIFVFGAKTTARIDKAIALYKQGFGKRLMVSGASPHYAADKAVKEAERDAQIARDQGVPESALVLETNSISIPDNVRSSLNLLDARGLVHQKVMLVNSPYTQRRGWAHFRKYLSDDAELIRVNAATAEKFSREHWYKNLEGIRVVLGEFVKLRVAVLLNTA